MAHTLTAVKFLHQPAACSAIIFPSNAGGHGLDQFANAPPPTADPRLRQLYEYWLSIHPGDGSLPGRQHIDPADFVALLPWVWLVDVQRDPLRFKYRLLSTGQVTVLGREYTGQWLDEAHPTFVTAPAYRQFVAAVERAEIGYRSGDTLVVLQKDYRSMERLIMPLARNGKDVDMLLGISTYQRPT